MKLYILTYYMDKYGCTYGWRQIIQIKINGKMDRQIYKKIEIERGREREREREREEIGKMSCLSNNPSGKFAICMSLYHRQYYTIYLDIKPELINFIY